MGAQRTKINLNFHNAGEESGKGAWAVIQLFIFPLRYPIEGRIIWAMNLNGMMLIEHYLTTVC